MTTQLEVSLLGGWTEKRLRKRRGAATNELPWGTIDPARYVTHDLDLARAMWTNGIFTEYASATAFSLAEPVRRRIASSSWLESDEGPWSRRRSRGRSPAGRSRMRA